MSLGKHNPYRYRISEGQALFIKRLRRDERKEFTDIALYFFRTFASAQPAHVVKTDGAYLCGEAQRVLGEEWRNGPAGPRDGMGFA